MLTANDYRNALAMINRASLQGAEVEEIASLKNKLTKALNYAVERESAPPPGLPNTDYDPADLPLAVVPKKG